MGPTGNWTSMGAVHRQAPLSTPLPQHRAKFRVSCPSSVLSLRASVLWRYLSLGKLPCSHSGLHFTLWPDSHVLSLSVILIH